MGDWGEALWSLTYLGHYGELVRVGDQGKANASPPSSLLTKYSYVVASRHKFLLSGILL